MKRSLVEILALSMALLLAPGASAQSAGETPEPATEPESPDAGAKSDQPKSLDDLLGLDEDEETSGAADAAERDRQQQLRKALTAEEMTDAFQQALQKMELSAELLGEKLDPGLGTQRVQEEILAKLQQLIDSARQNQGGSSSSSSSSSSQPQPNPQQNPGQKSKSNSSTGPRQNNPSDSNQAMDPPPAQEGDINTIIEESRTEWGNLPPRLRDQMIQGKTGVYSSLYQKLTAEYYKRLAEDGSY